MLRTPCNPSSLMVTLDDVYPRGTVFWIAQRKLFVSQELDRGNTRYMPKKWRRKMQLRLEGGEDEGKRVDEAEAAE